MQREAYISVLFKAKSTEPVEMTGTRLCTKETSIPQYLLVEYWQNLLLD